MCWRLYLYELESILDQYGYGGHQVFEPRGTLSPVQIKRNLLSALCSCGMKEQSLVRVKKATHFEHNTFILLILSQLTFAFKIIS